MLVLMVGAAHLLHSHSPAEQPDPACSLCAVAHMSSLPVPVLIAPVSTERVVEVCTAEQGAVAGRLLVHHLYIRPPPEVNVFA